ncbi:putative flagellar hook protein FlgE [Rickettsiales endosymbiont of Paramecium tredecaurelia]|uniref:hypothetical protein n=1 Tax=Candidatus Sarmatiella mevalonica TaxID=2770581 RepID=UPI001922F2BA|nr:hypothetical protein [Candidatus Sarmatiella mevalonica]MBL3284227.1 putative flagellar hook protein FlgE [Candidatus Sarmatiella mevalonica]
MTQIQAAMIAAQAAQNTMASNRNPGALNTNIICNVFSDVTRQSQGSGGPIAPSSLVAKTSLNFNNLSAQQSAGSFSAGPNIFIPVVQAGMLSTLNEQGGGITPGNISYAINFINAHMEPSTGFLRDANGNILLARSVDPKTDVPSALLSPIVVRSTRKPEVTTFANVQQNLAPNTPRIAGAGVSIHTDDQKIKNPIAYCNPGSGGNGVLMYGTNFKFASDSGSVDAVFRQTARVALPSPSNTVCGAKALAGAFSLVDTDLKQSLGLGLKDNAGFVVKIRTRGGAEAQHVFTFTQNVGKMTNSFSNMQQLLALIGAVPGVTVSNDLSSANIGLEDTDPGSYITFEGIAPQLGFTSIRATGGVSRCFSTMGALRSIINQSSPSSGIRARDTQAGIKIEANAKSKFKLEVLNATQDTLTSVAKKGLITGNYNGDAADIERDRVKDSLLTTITSVGHGLTQGDILRINLGGGSVAAVVVGCSDNTFTVARPTNADVAITNAAQTGQVGILNTNYARIGHVDMVGKDVKIADATEIAVTNAAPTNAVLAVNDGHGFAQDDIVYLQGGLGGNAGGNAVGDAKLPAGYYKVVAVDAGAHTVTLQSTADIIGGGGDLAAADLPAGSTIKLFKVGKSADFAAGGGAENSVIGQTIFENDGGDPPIIKFYVGEKSGLVAGKTVSFDFDATINANLAVAVTPKEKYEIKSVVGGYITFEAEAPLNNADVGKLNCGAGGDINNGNGGVPINLKVVYSDQTFTNLGMPVPQLGGRELILPPLYNPSLEGGGLTNEQFANGLVTQEFEVFSPNGQKQKIKMMFAKVDENNWVIELYNTQNTLLLNGTINFLDGGVTGLYEGPARFNVPWLDGSATSIALKFIGKSGQFSLTQFVGTNMRSMDEVEVDGGQAKASNGFEVSERGVYAVFDDGSKKLVGVLDFFSFANISALVGSGSVFQLTNKSGNAFVMDYGEGATFGQVYAPNVDSVETLALLAFLNNAINTEVGIVSQQLRRLESILNKLLN